jgi:metallophosphoesterase (TIGR03768 family)
VSVSRRYFLKYFVGSATVLGLEFSRLGALEKALAAGGNLCIIGNTTNESIVPTYPIATDVYTTCQQTVIPYLPKPLPDPPLLPGQVSEYADNGYGFSEEGPPFLFLRPDMTGETVQAIPDPSTATLLSFFTISDIHITDKESPALCTYLGYTYPDITITDPESEYYGSPLGNSSAYSGIMLYTTHVLDAAVQTINAVHKQAPFDFGISLGDAANNTQHNELRWYIDVLDGQLIQPSSGDHKGAEIWDYQKPYQAAGLDKSIKWYQVIGNHDQFWMGSAPVTDYIREALVGPDILSLGEITTIPPVFDPLFGGGFYYMGTIDGSTEYGELIDAGPNPTSTTVTADPGRYSLSVKNWMREFFNTTSKPAGHGFTPQMIRDEFACYSFHPKADIPIKVIVLDDTDKVGGGAAGSLDRNRFKWLKKQLDEGEAAGELMIICAHIPIRPYAQQPPEEGDPWALWSLWDPISEISEDELLATLHTYKNLILWLSGHVHRNAITPQPSPNDDPEYGFWEVETSSLRDFPQMFRRFDIVRNPDNNISIFALNIDVAVNQVPLPGGSPSPALTSRSYAISAQQIFKTVNLGPNIDPSSGVYNAELVLELSHKMRAKIARIKPVVSSFKINGGAFRITNPTVTLDNTIAGSTPTHYMASESFGFKDAVWLPYSNAPSFTLSPTRGFGWKTVYFRVKDGAGKVSAVVRDSIRGPYMGYRGVHVNCLKSNPIS